MGRSGGFRRDLHALGELSGWRFPSDMLIHGLDAPAPEYRGRGAVPKRPFERVDRWRDALSADAWTRINVRDGDKGPLEVEVATRRVRTKIKQRVKKYDETLVVIRSLSDEETIKYDFYFSNAPVETTAKEFARVALAAHRIEEAIKCGKSEAGLSHYEVRHWLGWHHHQTLSLIASRFLVRESLRGKKWTPAITVPQVRDGVAMLLLVAYRCYMPTHNANNKTRRLLRNEEARFYHYKARNRLPPLRINQRR